MPVFGAAALASAQAAFPSGPITLVVGFPPGGSNDVIARTLAPKLSEILGVPVIVENKPGASGAIGTAYVVNSKPDGQTITLGSTSVLSIGPHTNPKLPYQLTDLTGRSNGRGIGLRGGGQPERSRENAWRS